jgi:hypothetical protein
LLGVVGLVSALALYAGRPPTDDPGSKQVASLVEEGSRANSALSSISDVSALETFKKLRRLWIAAYRRRDPALVKQFAAPNAPSLRGEVIQEIRQLKHNGVMFRSRFDIRDLAVVSIRPAAIKVREVVSETPKFVNERTEKDVTQSKRRQILTVVWTMRRYGGEWRLFRSLITKARTERE